MKQTFRLKGNIVQLPDYSCLVKIPLTPYLQSLDDNRPVKPVSDVNEILKLNNEFLKEAIKALNKIQRAYKKLSLQLAKLPANKKLQSHDRLMRLSIKRETAENHVQFCYDSLEQAKLL